MSSSSKSPSPEEIEEAVRQFYDDRAAGYGDMIARAEYSIPHWVSERAPSLVGADMLDLACGTGNLTAALLEGGATGRSIGVDLSPRMVDEAEKRGIFETTVCHDLAQGLPASIGDQRFDVVLAFGFTEFLTEPVVLLRDIASVLRGQESRVWISFECSTPDSEPSGKVRPALGFPMFHYSRQEVQELLGAGGLTPVSIENRGSYLRSYDKQLVPWWVVEAKRAAI